MEQKKHDLRDQMGKQREDGNTNANLAGHEEKVMPTQKSGEHAVNPGLGSRDGVGEGQVTKSN